MSDMRHKFRGSRVAGGGERCRIGVGTIGVGSVRSYAAAGFGDDDENARGFPPGGRALGDGGGCAAAVGEPEGELAPASESMGAVWLRVGWGSRPRGGVSWASD